MEKRFIVRWMFVELANSVKFSKLAELLSNAAHVNRHFVWKREETVSLENDSFNSKEASSS